MKNHLQSLMLLTGRLSPQTPKTKSIREYLQDLLSGVAEASLVVSTGNMGLDPILSIKMTQLRELQITMESKLTIPASIGLTIEDSIVRNMASF